MKRAHGFTIVELLIVIVVIGILAAISIVAYNGVSSNANDSAVKSDLANFAKQVRMYHAQEGVYPSGGYRTEVLGGSSSGSIIAAPSGLTFPVSRSSYRESTGAGFANFIYCTGIDSASGQAAFSIVAESTSGRVFHYTSVNGMETGWSSGNAVATRCMSGMSYPRTLAYGFWSNSGGWQSWVQ